MEEKDNKEVVIYTTPTCGYCKMTKEYFKENSIDYKEIDVASDPKAAEEMIEKTGHVGVPQIFVGEDVVIGFDRPMLDKLLGINS